MTDSAISKGTELVPVQNALTEFEKVSAGIAELTAKYANVVYAVATTKGMDEAKAARLAIREPRYAVQRATDAAKKELNSIKKNVEERGAQIVAALAAIEDPIDTQIKAEEDRKATEKARKEQAERDRVNRIQAAISSIAAVPLNVVEASAEYIKQALDQVAALEITEEHYAEFLPHAANAKQDAVMKLISMHERAVAAERAKEELRAQQKELARMRAQVEAEMAAQRAEIARQKAELEEARTAAEAARAVEQQRISEAAARAEVAERARAIEEDRQSSIQQAEIIGLYVTPKGDASINLNLLPEQFQHLRNAELRRVIEQAPIYEGPSIEMKEHVNVEMPLDLPVDERQVFSKPSDIDIVRAVADQFDIELHVALEWITGIDVQSVVEAIAEAA